MLCWVTTAAMSGIYELFEIEREVCSSSILVQIVNAASAFVERAKARRHSPSKLHPLCEPLAIRQLSVSHHTYCKEN